MENCLERLKAYFGEHGVPYEIQQHRTAFTAQKVADALHEKGRFVAKVFIAWMDGKLAMLVLPAPAHVDYDRVRAWLGVQEVRAAHEDEFEHLFADCEVGAMPPFGNLYHLPVYLDRSLAEIDHLVFQAGTHRETMKVAMADYRQLVSPIIGDFALQPRAAMSA
jgi:Ala-tRNA(Pro) deacylase